MLLSALNYVQRDVAQVIVNTEDPKRSPSASRTRRRSSASITSRAPWDVSARLREIFAFLQKNLKGSEVDLREVEYAACNGMLHTLDPHSVFLSPEATRR
jgi:carboxyl-terminal processing protease